MFSRVEHVNGHCNVELMISVPCASRFFIMQSSYVYSISDQLLAHVIHSGACVALTALLLKRSRWTAGQDGAKAVGGAAGEAGAAVRHSSMRWCRASTA
jgi:hypothetical protein